MERVNHSVTGNNNNVYSALLCVSQSAVTQNKCYNINEGKKLEFEVKKLHLV